MIVGLHGKMGAGKNEAARRIAHLCDLWDGPEVVEVSFAAALKRSAAAVLGVSVAELERWKNDGSVRVDVLRWQDDVSDELSSQTVRSFLQRYGTEAHRDVFGQDFWLDAALPIGRGAIEYDDSLYVVTDVRFANEAERVRDLGGVVVRVVGPDSGTGTHSSEQVLDDVDVTIDNAERSDGFANLDRQIADLLVSRCLKPEERAA